MLRRIIMDGQIELSMDLDAHQYFIRIIDAKRTNKGRLVVTDAEGKKYYYSDQHTEPTKVISTTQFLKPVINTGDTLMRWAVNGTCDKFYSLYPSKKDAGGEYVLKGTIKQLLKESKSFREDAKNAAGDIGGEIHDWLEAYADFRMQGKSIAQAKNQVYRSREASDPIVKTLFAAGRKKVEKLYTEILASELLVYSPSMNVAGLIDIIGFSNSRLVVGDYKTSKYIYTSHIFQAGTYVTAYNESRNTGDPVATGVTIIHLSKQTGEAKNISISNTLFPVIVEGAMMGKAFADVMKEVEESGVIFSGS